MLIKFFTKLFCSRKQITQFNSEIVQMGQDARRMAVQSCNANLGQIFEASFADQKPSRWRWQSNQQPEPPVVDPSTSTPSQPRGNVSFALPLPRPVRAASSTQQGRKHRNFLQARSHQQQVLSTLSRATRRPQARYPQTQEQLPKSHFSGPTTRNHTAHLLDQDPLDQSIGPDISISRRNPESFARRNYNPGQAASSMEIPLCKQGLLLQFANVGELHNEHPDLLFKVDEPMTRRSEARAIYQTKRTIQTTISLLLEQLRLQSQCKSFLVSLDESELLPRLCIASSLLKIRERLKRSLAENANSPGYLDRLQAFKKDLEDVFSWFDGELSVMEIDAICANRENHVNYLLTRCDWVGLDFPYSEDMEVELMRGHERAMARVLV